MYVIMLIVKHISFVMPSYFAIKGTREKGMGGPTVTNATVLTTELLSTFVW